MDEDDYMLFVQLLVVGSVIVALITYLLRSMICRAKNDVGTKAILITGMPLSDTICIGAIWTIDGLTIRLMVSVDLHLSS